MMTLRASALGGLILLLTACGEGAPADRSSGEAGSGEPDGVSAPPARPQGPTLPGRGPTSFIGRWAAEVSWCANPQGAERPIEITASRFEGYENACEVAAIQEVTDGYVATLVCAAEGQVRSERAHFQVSNNVLRLTWLDRQGEPIRLNKCTTLGDTATQSPVAP